MPPSKLVVLRIEADQQATLRTLIVEGSAPFLLAVRDNPHFKHTGGTSVTHQILTDREIETLKTFVAGLGNKIRCWAPDGQTEGQALERKALLRQERVWPFASCPTCPWAEWLGEEPCGLKAWPAESIEELRRSSSATFKTCPEDS